MKLASGWQIGSVVVALATPFVVVAFAGLLFLNPFWFDFEQDRSGVAALTGYTPSEVRQVTGSILSDLVFGPPSFDVSVGGVPVLDARERSHMADVRTFLLKLYGAALVAGAIIAVAGLRSRGGSWFWGALAAGGKLTVAGVAVVGIGFAVFFEQAFELFHELFFSAGSYSFDPSKEKLVQLFPDQLWFETSVGIAVAVLGLALLVAYAAGRIAVRTAPPGGPVEPSADDMASAPEGRP
jgi:integral membrane protein (TIGR01906 family)